MTGVDTGLVFKGHSILLGPRHSDHRMVDKLVLTQLDRFIREYFPILSDNEVFVKGALSLKSKGNQDD